MKRIIPVVAVLALVVAGGFAFQVWGQIVGAGSSPEETAKIIVHDEKFGIRGLKKAIQYGDQIIPFIAEESKDFQELNGRNSFWIAEILGSIDSELSRKTLKELYQRKDALSVLVGSIGLCMHGAYPEQINEDSNLVRIVRKAEPQTETDLAIIALGYSGSVEALPALHGLLTTRPNDSFHLVYACEALARIRSPKSIPVLRSCLQDPNFYATSEAYRVATSLGDKESTALAIGRVSKDLEGKKSRFLIIELEKVTGKKHGYNKEKWEAWWRSDGADWQIPKKFLVEWDEQPKQY